MMAASRIFEAEYHGSCPRCADRIEPGDQVRYVDDELVHARHEVKPPPAAEICGTCWLTKPCECDD